MTISVFEDQRVRVALICTIALLWVASLGRAQDAAGTRALAVAVTTQSGDIRLPGVSIVVSAPDGTELTSQVTGEDGTVQISDLPTGLYRVRASLEGFTAVTVTARVQAAGSSSVSIDLPIAAVTETVDVIANAETANPSIADTFSTKGVLESRVIETLPIRDRSVLSALKLIAGVIDGPNGVSIKGGRSNQSGLQIGMATLTDSSTGEPLFHLPPDAIESVEVMPNPYAVEFGRFSSGLTLINTRKGGDSWRAIWNAPDISFRTARGQLLPITGIESFGPRIGFGGPIIKDKLFLEESAQLRYEESEIWSRPPDQTKNTLWFSSFTRLDASLSPTQSLTGTVHIFPSRADDVTMNTFNGPDVAADESDRLESVGLAAHSILPKELVVESTLHISSFDANVGGQGVSPMILTPMVNSGSFYNRQDRDTRTVQWVEAITASPKWLGIAHMIKAGFDVMATAFNGTSSSSPVMILRDNGTQARSLTYSPPIAQYVSAADLALFAQDRIQPHSRMLFEFGGRIDRDGILGQVNVTPRVGGVFLLDEKGTAVLRGGYGLFFERTPSVAGVFDQFETAYDARYAADGTTLLGPPQLLTHVTAPNIRVPRSRTWNAQYDQKINAAWSIRLGAFSREGTDELIVQPIAMQDNSTNLQLSSTGRSSYQDGEVTLRFAPSPKFELSGTYVRSKAEADLNAYTNFFDNVRWPIISTNEYAPVASDAPNRLVAHVRATIAERWFASGIFETHSGFPFSATNEYLDWVGPRNQVYHFPTVAMLDLDLEHRFTFLFGRPWIGIRAYNALNRFTPADVQNNIGSTTFGSFYNSYGRQLRLQVRFGG